MDAFPPPPPSLKCGHITSHAAAHLSVPCPLKSPNAPLVLNSLVALPGGGGSWVALRGGEGESVGVKDPLAPNWGSQGWRPAWDPLASPAVARRTRGTYPLQLPVADGHRGGGRCAVSELGRLPGSQQAPGEPAGPLAGHGGPYCCHLRPGESVSRRSSSRASLFYPPAVQEAELGAFPPPLPRSTHKRRVFLARTPTLPTPFAPARALRRLCKLCAVLAAGPIRPG